MLALLTWRSLVVAVAAFCALHGPVLRQLVRIYPKGDPRRAELIAELHMRPYCERPIYVAQCLEVALVEGLLARHSRSGQRVWTKIALADIDKQVARAKAALGDGVYITNLEVKASLTYRPRWKRLLVGPDISCTLRVDGTNCAGRPVIYERVSAVGRHGFFVSGRAVTRMTFPAPKTRESRTETGQGHPPKICHRRWQ
jgi:hypothetical protein